jgi:homoserine kinase
MSELRFVKVKAPATTANLGPGFDCLGLALDLYNTVELAVAETTSVEVTGFGAETLPRDDRNLILRSARLLAQAAGKRVPGWALRQHNDIHLARGMGSSSAAIVGGLVAANEALGAGLSARSLLDLAVGIEGHPDNVAPAMLGGLTVCCTDEEGLGVARFDPPRGVKAVLAIPAYEVSTEEARKVMPQQIAHSDGVFNTCHSTSVLAALVTGDMALLGQAMKDRLHEPYRASLVRGMAECVAAARDAGAHASALSGSGPTIVAFVTTDEDQVLGAMLGALRARGVTCEGRVANLALAGAEIVG